MLLMRVVMVFLCFGVGSFQYSGLITNEHNKYRRREGAANMEKMIWNRQLEQEATAWAARCSYSHQNGGRGENLSMHSITNDIPNLIKRMIEGWIGEKREYYPGRGFSMATGHYTQVVWASSNNVGCGVQICPPNYKFSTRYLYLVCFYNPPGNFNNQEPFVRGPVCSMCKRNRYCDKGLCL